MKVTFNRLLAMLLAVCMAVSTLTFAAVAADYPDVSTVPSATISEIKVNEPLDYEVGEDIVFKFQIKSGSTVVTAPYLYYSAVMDDGRTLKGYVEPVDGAYTVTLEGGLLKPGFVFMTVNACDANKSTLAVPASYKCGAGANIDEIQSIYGIPSEYDTYGDFDAFWDETLAQLDAEGGEATLKYIYYCGEYTFSNVTYDCYEVEINCPKDSYYDSINGNWCGTNHVSAYLTIPKGKTDLGLKLLYKGYDWVSASGSHKSIEPQSGICSEDCITLSVSPHSVPAPHNVPTGENASYLNSDGTAYLASYYASNGYLNKTYGYMSSHGKNEKENASPYTTYFKYMIMRDVQAVNFLTKYFSETGVSSTLNNVDTSIFAGLWDGVNIRTSGGSQGGYQAIAVAGLVPEVNEVSATVPWFADQGATSADSERYTPSNPRNFPYGEGLRYVDTANLAAKISSDCTVTMAAGLIDDLCPPSTIMSIYNNLNCDASLMYIQNQRHSGSTSGKPYTQTISKSKDTAEKNHTINYVSEFDAAFKADFEAAWAKVCDDKVVSVDIYAVDKNTTTDFTALAASSTSDAIGIILTGDGLTNINAKLAEIYDLHNDMFGKVWVIGNDGNVDGKNAAITLSACMNWGNKPTGGASIALYGANGVMGQSFVLTADETYAVIPSPLWVSGQGIVTTTENVILDGGLMSSTGEDGSMTFRAPSATATFETVGVGDAEAYGNIEGVGLWIYNAGKLTIKGAGAMPDYASAADAPWAGKAVTEIDITDGVTSLGAYNFAEFTATLNIPISVDAIDATAIKAGSTIVGYDNAYAKTFADTNKLTFTNLGAAGTIGDDLYWHLDLDTGLFTVSGTGTDMFAQDADGNMLSPSSPWTESNWSAAQYYNYRAKITKIVIEAPIKSIQSYCLTFINNCTTVELPEAYTGTNTIAFHGMAALTCIYTKGQTPEVGTANLSNLTIVGNYSMVQVPVTKVILNDKVTSIGTQVFHSCTKLTEINLPTSLKSIGDKAFYNCKALTSLTLPETLTSVDTDSFDGCTGVKTLTVKNSSLDISGFAPSFTALSLIIAHEGSAAHTYATANNIAFEAYEEVVASGDAGTDLYWKVVKEGNTHVLKIYGTGTTVYSGATGYNTQSKSAWYDYYNDITKVVLCESVTTISKYAFTAMKNLKTLEVTKNLTNIQSGVFQNCTNLSTIYVAGNTAITGTYDLSYVTSMTGGYQFDGAGKSVINNIIFSDSLTGAIGDKFVSYNTSLTEIEFPEGVTSLANRTVYNCSALKTMTVLGAETTIGENFLKTDSNTTVLTTIRGVEGSPAQTYADANSITFVSLAEPIAKGKAGEDLNWKVTQEEDESYTMTIYGTGTYIRPYITETGEFDTSIAWNEDHSQYDWADYAGSITKIVIEAPVTKILGYTFASFNNATTLELPTSMTALQSGSCFNDMDAIYTVYTTGQTPEVGTANLSNISYIYDYAFVKSAFKKIIFKENVSIGKCAFMWNKGLETLELPEGVTIGSKAFGFYTQSYNNKLTTISFPASLSEIPYDCFRMTNDNSTFTANAYVTTITVKNSAATFEGATEDAPYTAFLDNFTALTTVYGYDGSSAEAMVEWANANTERELTFIALEAPAVATGSCNGATWEVTNGSDGKYVMTIGGDVTALPAATAAWGWDDYKANVTKVVITAPITSLNGTIKDTFKNVEILELPVSCVSLGNSALNDGSKLHTVYTTGQEMVKGTFNLTNISSIGTYCIVFSRMDTLILAENCKVSANALYWTPNLSKLVLAEGITMGKNSFVSGTATARIWDVTSIEFPASMAVIPAESFNRNNGTGDSTILPNNTITEITVNNPNALFAGVNGATVTETNTLAYHNEQFVTKMEALATVKGKAGSTAEAFVNWANEYFETNSIDRSITFVAIDTVVDGMPIGEDLYFRILNNEDGETYTMEIYGTGATAQAMSTEGVYLAGGYDNFFSNKAYEKTTYWQYASKISKIKFSAPNVTKITQYLFQSIPATELELHPNMTALNADSFNGMSTLRTVYTTGQTAEEGVANLTNVTSLGGQVFYCNRFTKVVLSESLTSIPSHAFGNNKADNSLLEAVEIPASVTSIGANAFVKSPKIIYVKFNADSFTYNANSFSGISANATIIAADGSTGETLASELGVQFIDSAEAPQIDYYYYVDNSVLLLAKVGEKYTAFATGSDTKFELGYKDYNSAVYSKDGSNGPNRAWNDYKSLITKVVYVNPALTYTDASFATHTALTTIEAPASLTTLGSNAYNGCKALKTFYITGNEMKVGVANFSNITDLGSMGIASCAASTILLNDDYNKNLGDNLFFQCPNLTYIRIPAGVGALTDKTFNGSKKLTTVLFENPNTTIGTNSFTDCTGLTTFIGYNYKEDGVTASTAKAYAEANGLTFIPIEATDVLSFDGFQIRESVYNGLRSMYSVDLTAISAREAKGLYVVEYGSLLASTDKLAANEAELTISKDENGNYVTHDYAKKFEIYCDGALCGNYISKDDNAVEYACTVRDFSASNYSKKVTSRGYIIYADKEGNEYVVYADLYDGNGSNTDSEGNSYNSMSLESLCEKIIAKGTDLTDNICWQDVLKFREATLN